MGIKSKRVAFTFDDRSLRTLDQMQAEGHFDGPDVQVRPVPPPPGPLAACP